MGTATGDSVHRRRAPDDIQLQERPGLIDFFLARYPQAISRFGAVAQADPPRRGMVLAYVAFAQHPARDYSGVVATMEAAGPPNLLDIDQMRVLAKEPPHQVEPGAADRAVFPFLQVDPLPVIEIEVNSRSACVLIDTGAAQLVLDSECATEFGVQPVSTQEVKGFAGGKAAPVSYGLAESVSLGEIALGNVPVWVLPTGTFSSDFGRRIDDILATEVLMQFPPTLAYRDGELIRRLLTEESRAGVRHTEPKATAPFVIDGIHCMYAQCFINEKGPVLVYVDSGLADERGAALGLSRAALDDLQLPRSALSEQGVGGAGTMAFGYVPIESIRVGDLARHDQLAT